MTSLGYFLEISQLPNASRWRSIFLSLLRRVYLERSRFLFVCKSRASGNKTHEIADDACSCFVHKSCLKHVPQNCGDPFFKSNCSGNLTLVRKFFYMLQDAYELLRYGDDTNTLKLHFSPIFPNSRVILHFLLCNSIAFEPRKIDYLYGDFKEDPILVDGELILTDW